MYHDRDTFEQLYPARDTLQHVISGVTEGGKTLPVFTSVNEHNYTNMKPQAKTQVSLSRRETAASGGKQCR